MVAEGPEFLNAAEQLTLLHDVSALAGSGDLKITRALDVAVSFANSPERQIVAQAKDIVAGPKSLVPKAQEGNYARFVEKVFGARARSLGWSAKPDEELETRLLRPNLVPFVARYDAALEAEARKLADGWLENRRGVDADMLSSVLSVAAHHADRGFFDILLRELKKTEDRRQRGAIIRALGSFEGSEAGGGRARPDDPFRYRHARNRGLCCIREINDPATERMPFEFVKANFDEILKRAPSGGGSDFGAILPTSAGSILRRGVGERIYRFLRRALEEVHGRAARLRTDAGRNPPVRGGKDRPGGGYRGIFRETVSTRQGSARILMLRNHTSDEWFCKLIELSRTIGVSAPASFGSMLCSAV